VTGGCEQAGVNGGLLPPSQAQPRALLKGKIMNSSIGKIRVTEEEG